MLCRNGEGRSVNGTLSLVLLITAAGGSPLGAAADAGAVLGEIIVSARKRDESALRVPITLSVLPGQELTRSNTARVKDIARFLANVSTDIQQPRLASIAIRGLGRNPASDGLESSVGLFMDGVYLGRPGMVVTDLIDLERIEVLRGPQGTLFGKNATAGALNIVTRAPASEPEGWIEISGGNYQLRQARAALSGPLIPDKLAFRLSGFSSRREGFTEGTVLGMRLLELNRFGVRGQLRWQPAEDASVRVIADYSSLDEAGPGFLLVDPQSLLEDGSARPGNYLERAARLGYVPEFDPRGRRIDAEAEQRSTGEQAGVSVHVDLPVGLGALTSVSAWREWNFRPRNDGDGTALRIQPVLGTDARYRQASQELRLSSPPDAPLASVIGAYLFHQELQSTGVTTFGPDAAPFLEAGLPPVHAAMKCGTMSMPAPSCSRATTTCQAAYCST